MDSLKVLHNKAAKIVFNRPTHSSFSQALVDLEWVNLRKLLKRGAGNRERKSGNELSAETSTKIQNGGPKNEREKEEDKERNSCLG